MAMITNAAMLSIMAMGDSFMAPSVSEPAAAIERLLAHVFRDAGWSIKHRPRPDRSGPGLRVQRGELEYVVEVKYASEARRDRMIPLLAQAILQAQAVARARPAAAPLAVIGAPRISEALADEVRRFANEHAPGVAVGVMGLDGFRAFFGPSMEALSAQ